MSTNKTAHYQLNQWEPNDQVLRTEFNADNAKVDAALKTQADQLASHSAAMGKLGNCRIYTKSYVGTGATPNTIQFPQRPVFVHFTEMGGAASLSLLQGTTKGQVTEIINGYVDVSWQGNSVSLSSMAEYTSSRFNADGVSYQVMALLDASAG